MTGVAWSFEEPSAAARVLKDFVKENEKLKIKAGAARKEVLAPRGGRGPARALPSKDEARARLSGHAQCPGAALVMLLNAATPRLVGVLAAKQRKDEGG
jgi:large subunit ribosomal protein L10